MGLYRWFVLKLAGWMGLLKPRTYRVTLFGESLGTYRMPRGHHMPDPNAEERPILTRPFRMSGADNFYIYWVEPDPKGGFRMMAWSPETPDDTAAAERFYYGTHGLKPDGTPDPAKQPPPPARSGEETRLIAAVLANPDAEQPYLDYANWLTSKNDAAGEYIRLTWQIEKLPEGDRQREQLEERRHKIVQRHGARWVRPLTDLGLFPGILWAYLDEWFFPDMWHGKRGVIEELDIPSDAPVFPAHAASLFHGAPFLRKLSVNNLDITVANLGTVPQMAQLESLSVNVGAGSPEDYRKFAELPHLTGLRELRLTGHRIDAESAAHLARAKWLANLRVLDLGINNIGDDGAEALAESPHVANLTTLGLGNNGLTDRGLVAVCRSPNLAKLTTLPVEGGSFTASGIAEIAPAAFARNLTSINLNHCGIDTAGARALAAGRFPALKELLLASGPIGADGARALVAAPWFASLERLSLNGCETGDAAADALAAAGFLALRDLDLGGNQLTDAGVTALARSKAATKLTKLSLWNNPFGPAGAKALAETDLPALEELDLSRVDIGRAGTLALAGSPYLKKLTRLTVSAESVGLIGRDALIRRFTDRVVSCY